MFSRDYAWLCAMLRNHSGWCLRTIWNAGINLGFAICKANALYPVLSLWFLSFLSSSFLICAACPL